MSITETSDNRKDFLIHLDLSWGDIGWGDDTEDFDYYSGYVESSEEEVELYYLLNEKAYRPDSVISNNQANNYTYSINDESLEKDKHFYYTYSFNISKYTQLDDFGIKVLINEDFYLREDELSTSRVTKISKYSDKTVLETDYHTMFIHKTNYGYLLEQYSQDKTKSEYGFGDSQKLTLSLWNCLDNRVIDFTSVTRLDYSQQPVHSLNPMLKYLLR